MNDKSTSDTLEKERNAVRHWASSLRGERKKKNRGKDEERERERGSSLRFRRFSLLFKSLEEKSQFFFSKLLGLVEEREEEEEEKRYGRGIVFREHFCFR